MSGRAPFFRRIAVGVVLLLVAPFALFFLVRGTLALANALLERRYPPPGQMIDVGNHRLHLFCQGAGSPTVVIEPGLGVDWVAWQPIVAALTPSTEVCVYDRAGYGWSEAGAMPRTADRSAVELHELLARSKHNGPIVLVAHSFGGHVARVYAARFGGTLAGVVLVDPTEGDRSEIVAVPAARASEAPRWSLRGLIDRLPPLGWERVKRLSRGDEALPPSIRALPAGFRHRVVVTASLDQLAAERSELESSRASQLEAWAAVPPRQLPLIVITPLYPGKAADPAARRGIELRRNRHLAIAAGSASGVQVFAERSGHMVHLDQPELVLDVVRGLLSRHQGGSH